MADDQNIADWAPGQPPPWLAAYGAPQELAASSPGGQALPVGLPPAQPQIDEAPRGPDAALAPIDPYAGSAAPDPAPQTGPVTSPQQVDPGLPAMPVGGPIATPQPPGPVLHPDAVPLSLDEHAAAMARLSPADQLAFTKQLPADQQAAEIGQMTPAQQAQAASAMSPEQYRKYKEDYQARLIAEEATQRAKIENDNLAREQQAYFDRQQSFAHSQQATNELMGDAQRIANTKIDPDRFSKNLGVSGTIGALIASTVGGAMSQYTGGKNLALESFQKRIDQDIDAQKSDITNQWRGIDARKGAIADEFARHGDLYRAQETYRVAAYQSAINQMQAHLQQFDPQGATAIRTRDSIDQFHAAQGQAIQAYQQQAFKNQLEVSKDYRENQAQFETTRHNRAQEGIEWSKVGIEKDKTAAENQKFTPDELAALHPGADVPPVGMSLGNFAKWQERMGKVKKTETIGGVPSGVTEGGQVKWDAIRNANGKPLALDEKQKEKIGPVVAGADKVNRLANRLSREIAMWGGQSDLAKSPHWQDMKSDYQDLIFALHEAKGIEGFRPGTSDLLHELTGDVDPTSFLRNATPGILRAKQNVIEDTDATLRRVANYDGPAFTLPDTSKPPEVTKSDVDQLVEQANSLNSIEQHSAVLAFGGNGTAVHLAQRAGEAQRGNAITALLGIVKQGDAQAKAKALAGLKDIADTAPDDDTRARAKTALVELQP